MTRGAAGGLQIVPVIRADGGEPAVPVAFIGTEAHGAVCVDPAEAAGGEPGSWRFWLARLVRPVPPALQKMALGGESLQVPAAEELRFRDRYYPRLRHTAAVISSDGSFTPPAISGPDLVLRARYSGGHELEVSWEWAYRVGDSPLHAPLEPAGPDDGYRDLAAERALLDGLGLPLDRYGLLGPDGGRPGAAPRALAPRTCLTGIDTMRFTTELLRQLSLHAGLVDEAHASLASAKIDALVGQLQEVTGGGHRALVFSQFTAWSPRTPSRRRSWRSRPGKPGCSAACLTTGTSSAPAWTPKTSALCSADSLLVSVGVGGQAGIGDAAGRPRGAERLAPRGWIRVFS